MSKTTSNFNLMAMESIIKQMYVRLNRREKERVLRDLRYSINFELCNRSAFDNFGDCKKGELKDNVIS